MFKYKERCFVSKSGNVYYLDNGNVGKPVLVLVHGFSDFPENLIRSTLFLRKNYHIILPALKGFDKEGVKPGDHFSLEMYANQIIELMDSINVDQFVIGGSSLGGATSLKVYSKVPNRVSRLIIMDSAGFEFDGIETIVSKVKAGGKNPFFVENEEQFDLFFKQLFYKVPRELSLVKKFFLSKYISQREAYEYLANQLFLENHQSLFVVEPHNIKVPSLVVWGEHDAFFPAEIARRIHDQAKESTLAIIHASGHLPHLEKPFILAKTLRDFLI